MLTKDGFPITQAASIAEWREWLLNAKRPATRAKHVQETVELAARNERANQYRK